MRSLRLFAKIVMFVFVPFVTIKAYDVHRFGWKSLGGDGLKFALYRRKRVDRKGEGKHDGAVSSDSLRGPVD